MLRVLRIRNFAIIDELEISLNSGFNVLTGETGAGKSIVLDAIGLILGGRANAELIREGFSEASVEALFDIGRNEKISNKLSKMGIGAPDQELLIKRVIHRNGKNRIFINSDLSTLSNLSDLCENLVELCSQHEHQSLVKSSYQLDLLDRYGGLDQLVKGIAEEFNALSSLENELRHAQEASLTPSQQDFLEFQIKEIEENILQPSQESELQNELRRLQYASVLLETCNTANQILEGSEEKAGVSELLKKVLGKLSRVSEISTELASILTQLEAASVQVDESLQSISHYASSVEANDTRLDELQERLAKWQSLKKKYGADFDEITRAKDALRENLSLVQNKKERVEELEKLVESRRHSFCEKAQVLSKKRKAVAKTLSESIENELRELQIDNAKFKIEFETTNETSEMTASGCDRVQFLFCPNPGEGFKIIGKVASGGELSRLMLALRRTIADRGGVGVYLFDEVDAGIGGQVASVVGKKLKSVSKYNQILCITHLPQVAVFADTHFNVSKSTQKGRTISKVECLTAQGRIDEIARMLGGLNITEKSRAHAKDLITQAK
ncbi:MAG: DNA repair protein RecN [Bacteriovoracia bacterium]